ncbi:hypothetical protein NDU88_006071 [Pleurodeles waltl]|uniref:Secreted protein n=1 Tax=Pleurodeles waltl TaxID=8319 RepID=A0AAV7QJ13_PLEWA|nr:hypothetical protein NDU88_006071 [Pleurodeles waltl]
MRPRTRHSSTPLRGPPRGATRLQGVTWWSVVLTCTASRLSPEKSNASGSSRRPPISAYRVPGTRREAGKLPGSEVRLSRRHSIFRREDHLEATRLPARKAATPFCCRADV